MPKFLKDWRVWLLAALALLLCVLAWVLRPVSLTGLLGPEPQRIGLTLDYGDDHGLQSRPIDRETQEELFRRLSEIRLSWRGPYRAIAYPEDGPIVTVTFQGEVRRDFHLTGDGSIYLDDQNRYAVLGGGGPELFAALLAAGAHTGAPVPSPASC